MIRIKNNSWGFGNSVFGNMKKPKRSKYGNSKVKYLENGVEKVKDSKKEYSRFLFLKQLEKEGSIKDLQEQVRFVLQPKIEGEKIRLKGKNKGQKYIGTLEKGIIFIADFVYFDCEVNQNVVEDVKSWITKRNSTYILKRKMFKNKFPQYLFRET